MKPLRMLHESTVAGFAVVAFSLQVQVSGSVMGCRMVYRVVPAGILDCAVMRAAVGTDPFRFREGEL